MGSWIWKRGGWRGCWRGWGGVLGRGWRWRWGVRLGWWRCCWGCGGRGVGGGGRGYVRVDVGGPGAGVAQVLNVPGAGVLVMDAGHGGDELAGVAAADVAGVTGGPGPGVVRPGVGRSGVGRSGVGVAR